MGYRLYAADVVRRTGREIWNRPTHNNTDGTTQTSSQKTSLTQLIRAQDERRGVGNTYDVRM